MRARGLLGMAAMLVLLPASVDAAGSGNGGMRAAPMGGGFGGVPSYGLRAPAPQGMTGAPRMGGGWSQNGWQGGNWNGGAPRPPMQGGGNWGGGHGGQPNPGMPGGPGGPGKPGGWHNGGWQGGNGNWHGGNGNWGNGHSGGGNWHGGYGHGGNWGGGYHRPFRGWRMPSFWLSPTYFIPNYGYYGLGDPGYGNNWVRYYDDAVLVNGYGDVQDSVSGLDWDRYDQGPVPDYAGPDRGYPDRGYPDRGYDYGNDDQVTYGGGQVYHVAPGSVTTIVVQTQPVVTTTTETFVEERTVYVKPRPKPVRKWRPRRCGCYR